MAAIRAILYDTFESTWLPNLTEDAARAYQEEDRPGRYIATRGHRFWVAAVNGAVVALVDWNADFVNALHVRASHARLGIGTQLMNLAEAAIARSGHATVRLETDTFNFRSQAFYFSRGYSEIDRYPDAEWNSGLTTVLLSKSLD